MALKNIGTNMFKKVVGAAEDLNRDGFIGEGAQGSINAQRFQKKPSPEDSSFTRMNELDDTGWGHVHHAAFRGFVKSVERFVKASPDQLEFETGDGHNSTPLLLAVSSGNMETIRCVVDLGANLAAVNSQNHGCVELAAMKEFVTVLEYFIQLNSDKLAVWKLLLKFLSSESDEEGEAAGKCLCTLTEPSVDGVNPNWQHVYNNGGVPIIVKVIKGTNGDGPRIQALYNLINIVTQQEVKDQAAASGGIPPLVHHLKSSTNLVIQLSACALKEICTVKAYADQAVSNQALPTLIKVIQTVKEASVLLEAVEALGVICEANPQHQDTLGGLNGALQSVVELFDDCKHKDLLMALTKSVGRIACEHTANQTSIVDHGGSSHIIALTTTKVRELQMNSVEAIHRLADNNPHTQHVMIEEGAVMPLMHLLKRNRAQDMQEKTAGALWALAGENDDERRSMAGMMGVQLLIEFLGSLSQDLHFIGSEALGVLGQGPHNKQTAISDANGVHPLVRLLRSNKEHIVLSAIRSLRYLCIGVGYVPHMQNQTTLAQSRGLKYLVALMVHSRSEDIQVESALALGCAALGHPENLDEIRSNLDFSYARILTMMYNQDPTVRLLAGAALAAFAFNNLKQQKEIAVQGGVLFKCFVPFLKSDSEYFRLSSAFQLVVLSRIIPDQEQAMSSAVGIKLITDIMQSSRSNAILALASDCVARLAHTRAGVPAAIVSVSAVNTLCDQMLSDAEVVRGSAAIALGYLSYNHTAERQLLNRCRVDTYLMKVLLYYCDKDRISSSFIEEWKHYKKIGLPPIQEGRPSLVSRQNSEVILPVIQDKQGHPLTILSLGENASNARTSPINYLGQVNEDNVGRYSRSSRTTNHTVPLQRSRLSLHSEGSKLEHQSSNSIAAE